MGLNLFYHVSSERMRKNDLNFCQVRFRLDIEEFFLFFFTVRVVKALEWTAQGSGGATISGSFQVVSGCGTWRSGLGVITVVLGWQLDWVILKVSSNLGDFCDSELISVKKLLLRLFRDWSWSWMCCLHDIWARLKHFVPIPLISFLNIFSFLLEGHALPKGGKPRYY